MNSIKQLRILYTLPLLLSVLALFMSVVRHRALFAVLGLALFLITIIALQLSTVRVKAAIAGSLSDQAEKVTLVGALLSSVWTTLSVALLISLGRH